MLGVRRTGEAPGHGSVCETDAARTELLLAAIMGLRYLISGKFMPSGLVAILSFVMYRYNMKDVEK